MSLLFSKLRLRGVEFKNRIFVAPMCQYSSQGGIPGDWHMVHLGSRAVGGAALVMAEASSVSPEGRISLGDTGMWSERHAEAFEPIARFVKEQDSVPAIQLSHAGRKASSEAPWRGRRGIEDECGGWTPVAPSAIRFAEHYREPREMGLDEIDAVVEHFAAAARFSLHAGFEVVELHMAHGYLMHEFLSPLSNDRKDDYGGGLENRMRLPLRVAEAVRGEWPGDLPLFARISATDWVEGGWTLEESVKLSQCLKAAGVDLIDCSSGGSSPSASVPVELGYQVPFASRIRREVGIATGAVGLIVDPVQAEKVLVEGKADAVLLARELLRNPYWPLYAANALGEEVRWPVQYERAWPPPANGGLEGVGSRAEGRA